MENDPNADIQHWLDRLRVSDNKIRQEAVDGLLTCSYSALERLASMRLTEFPLVKRFEDTGDIHHCALMRLRRALLDNVLPNTPKHFFGLAATEIRRELLDRKDHYFGPEGSGAKQVRSLDGCPGDSSGGMPQSPDPTDGPLTLAQYTEMHEWNRATKQSQF